METYVPHKIAECPHCEQEQELALFEGNFYDFRANPVNDPVWGWRTALKHRKLYICEQCATEAESGHYVYLRKKTETQKTETPRIARSGRR